MITDKKNYDLISTSKGFVTIFGVRIGMTRKEAKDTLLANGFEVKENQRCLYIENVSFDNDLPPLNNICYGIDDAYHISHIRLWPNTSNKVIATRFYERYLTIVKKLCLSEGHKDKWLGETTLSSQYYNYINTVSVVGYFASSNFKGEVDTTRCHTMFYVSIAIDKETDVKRVKEQYYKLINHIATSQIEKTSEKKSKLYSIYENNKGTVLVSICFLWILFCGIGIFLFDMSQNKDSGINTFYSSLPSTNKHDVVYICTGLNAKKYHSNPNCRWLENCSGEVQEVSLDEAEAQGKSPCKGCH